MQTESNRLEKVKTQTSFYKKIKISTQVLTKPHRELKSDFSKVKSSNNLKNDVSKIVSKFNVQNHGSLYNSQGIYLSSLSIPTATDSKKSSAAKNTTEKDAMDFTMTGLHGMKNKSLSIASRNVTHNTGKSHQIYQTFQEYEKRKCNRISY